MSNEARLLRLANRVFKAEGMQLRADAARAVCKYAANVVESYIETGREPNEENILSELVDAIKARRGRGGALFVEVDDVVTAIESLKYGVKMDVSSHPSDGTEQKMVHDDIEAVAMRSVSPTSESATNLALLEEARRLASKSSGPDPDFMKVISAFDHLHFVYQGVRKTFQVAQTQAQPISTKLMGTAKDKAAMLQERLQIVEQRMRRREANLVAGIDAGNVGTMITQIESLLGSPGVKSVLGMLSKLEEDCWYLENGVTSVPLDLTQASIANSILCDHSFVLVQGELKDISELPPTHPLADRSVGSFTASGLGASGYVFRVSAMRPPDAEPRSVTLKAFPELDQFGLRLGVDQRRHRLLTQQLLSLRKDDQIIFIADIYLDDTVVMNRLKGVIATLAPQKPSVIVFMGNFFSEKFAAALAHHEDLSRVTAHFDALADLIGEYGAKMIGHTEFVFIPGPTDPGSMGILPQPALLNMFTRKLKQKLQRVQCASNPARLLYYGIEIVLYRFDLLNKLRRHALFPPVAESATELTGLLASVLTEQGHLCPVHLNKQPIYWNFDHALRLYPLPKVLVIADAGAQQFEWGLPAANETDSEAGLCINPGSFSSDGGGFICYWPQEGKARFNKCL